MGHFCDRTTNTLKMDYLLIVFIISMTLVMVATLIAEAKCLPNYTPSVDNKTCIPIVRPIGETCDEALKCDTPLSCLNGTCECPSGKIWNGIGKCIEQKCRDRLWDRREDQEVLYEDDDTGECLLKIYDESIFSHFKSGGTKFPYHKLEENLISCPANALFRERDLTNSCICNLGFIPSADRRKCDRGKLEGEPCTFATFKESDTCATNTGLRCNIAEGVCTCDSIPDSSSSDGPGPVFWNATDSLCYSDKACTERQEHLFFGSGTAYYDVETNSCRLPIGSPCKGLQDKETCPGTGICIENDTNSTSFKCECPSGLMPVNSFRQCAAATLGYGHDCIVDCAWFQLLATSLPPAQF